VDRKRSLNVSPPPLPDRGSQYASGEVTIHVDTRPRLLGINRNTVRKKVTVHGIDRRA